MGFFIGVGFVAMVIVLGYVTMTVFVLALNGLGEYNIGGVPNTITTKIKLVLLMCFVISLWALLLKNAPFTISFMG